MGQFSLANLFGITIRESANDGSDFTNPDADYRRLFLGEDGNLHVKDSAGTVTDIGGGTGAPTDATYLTTSANGSLSNEVVVTAPATGGIITKFVRKTANETVNTSAALQDDDDLLFAVGASEVWEFECVLWYESATTPDLKVAFTCPAAATLWWVLSGLNDTGTQWNENGTIVGSGTAAALFGGGAASIRSARLRGLLVNSTNAGNLTLQWAQNTSNGSNTIVYANSTLKGYRLV